MNKANIEDIYKLSPTQQGMLFHTLEDAGSQAYFQQITGSIHERLDAPAFRRAWERVMERHPVLRTAFFWKEAQRPLQVVNRQVSLPWEEHDWRELPAAEQEGRWSALLREDRERGFELAQAPLMRLIVVRLTDDLYRLVWSHHHLLLDGWSLPLLLQEVLAFYGALRSGTDLHLERPRAYRDYIAWLEARDPAEAEAFWRRELAGFGAPTPLGLEPRTASSREDRELRATLDEETTAVLNNLTRRLGLTLNTLVQGAWALALAHQAGEEDVVFGFTASGRPADLPGVESMIGLFINTVPVRVRVDRARCVADWLRDLQEQLVELRRFEFTPLSQVQAWSEVPAGEPLFESLLVFENYPVGETLASRREMLDVRDVGTFERPGHPSGSSSSTTAPACPPRRPVACWSACASCLPAWPPLPRRESATCRPSRTPSAGSSWSGARLRRHGSRPRSRRFSRSRPRARRTPSRWSTRTRSGPSASWPIGRSRSPCACNRWAYGPASP
jgi:hypothetical protein